MKRAVVVVLAMIAAYLAIAVFFGRFTTTDEIAFKAAGREWAQSGRFAAPELTGFHHLQPPVEEIWLAHVPVYTFLFGAFVRLFGFGATQSVAFDALIHAVLALLAFAHARRMHAPPWVAVLACALILPLGTLGRADELAICFGMAGLLVMAVDDVDPTRTSMAGLLLGLSAATSIMAAAFLGVVAIVQAKTVRNTLVLLAAAAVSSAACLAPILISHPSAWRQFGEHASSQLSLQWWWGIVHSWTFGKQYLLSAGAAVTIALAAAALRRRDVLRRFTPAFALLLVLAFLPAKSYYLWFVTPLLLAAACATAWELRTSHGMRVAAVLAAVLQASAMAEEFRKQVIVATLPTAQRLAPNVAAVHAHVPRGSVVMASELWSSLGNDVRYRSLVHGTTKIEDAGYVILTGNGSGAPHTPQRLDSLQQAALASQFDVVYDNLRRDVPHLFGVPISNSGWGYGVRIYRNRRHLGRGLGS